MQYTLQNRRLQLWYKTSRYKLIKLIFELYQIWWWVGPTTMDILKICIILDTMSGTLRSLNGWAILLFVSYILETRQLSITVSIGLGLTPALPFMYSGHINKYGQLLHIWIVIIYMDIYFYSAYMQIASYLHSRKQTNNIFSIYTTAILRIKVKLKFYYGSSSCAKAIDIN